MAFIPAPGVARCEMIYNLSGEIVENVYHFSKATPYALPELTGIALMMQSWEQEQASSERASACVLTTIRVTALDAQNSPQFVMALNPTIAGQRGSPALPGSVSYAVKLQTERGTRGSQGRTFWVGLAEDQVTGNEVIAFQADNIRANVEGIMTLLLTNPERGKLSVLHSMRNNALLNPRVATEVTAIVLSNLNVDRQGSRLPGKHRKKRTPAP